MPEIFKKLKVLDLFSGILSAALVLALKQQAALKLWLFAKLIHSVKRYWQNIGLMCQSLKM